MYLNDGTITNVIMDYELMPCGNRNPFPRSLKRALATGETLGIYRDYPVSNGCTSPFAPIWINEMYAGKAEPTEQNYNHHQNCFKVLY
jgi:hypothetical protein